MTKVTDLKREVKKNLERKHISDFTDLNLREIKIEGRTDKAVSTSVNNLVTKVGKALVLPILESDLDVNNKIQEIENIINNEEDIKVFIKEVDSGEKEKIELLKEVAKGKADNDTFLEIIVNDGENIVKTYSWLNFEAKKKNEGIYGFRKAGANYYSVTGLYKVIGTIYLTNAIRKYCENNKDMASIITVEFSELTRLYIDWFKLGGYFPLKFIYNKSRNGHDIMYEVDYPKVFAFFTNFLIELNKEEVQSVKTARKLSSDYARSFETKKNIPKKTLAKMEDNLFLTHFGYVELDELVDLEKIERIEDEWVEINKQIAFPIKKDHSLRFRRLGKHNAGGLYFPNAKAVCVDLSSPSSMIHEIMHMIDYTTEAENLSSSHEFRKIINRYRRVTDFMVENLPEDDLFKTSWNSSNKYNKSYYQSPKEIFARCGEIYIRQILEINSSLVDGNSNEILYPQDAALLIMIEGYFRKIIGVNLEMAI